MQKSDFTNLIKKYYLEGQCPSVKWVVSEKNLKVEFVSEDRSMKGSLDANFDLQDGEFGIYDTDKLLSITAALDNDFSIDYAYERNKPVGLKFDDKTISATFMLADMSIIPNVPPTKSSPEFDITIELKKDLIDRFIRSKKALTDSNVVALIPNEDSVDFVINFSEQNTNRIMLSFPANVSNSFQMIAINANVLSSIFSANSDFKEGQLNISERAGVKVEFKGEDFITTYLLPKIEIH